MPRVGQFCRNLQVLAKKLGNEREKFRAAILWSLSVLGLLSSYLQTSTQMDLRTLKMRGKLRPESELRRGLTAELTVMGKRVSCEAGAGVKACSF